VKFRIAALGFVGSLLGACSAGVADGPTSAEDTVGNKTEDIVRGRTEKRLPQVVAVVVNGYSGSTLCSGTYFDSRMVVTAAHCMRADAIVGQTFVYFGKDYLADKNVLPEIPAPGAHSNWARVETTVVHPQFDASLNYVDMAVLFLDRELPFDPIPLNRRRVSDSTRSGVIAGWGGSKALTPDISQVEGSGIKRSATVKLLGSPTAADYHADDPNAGMLDPAIRKNLLKTDGRAPSANPCAGDSGGPLFTETHGDLELSGVGFWTGLSCEDYAIFSRIEPQLAFLDAEMARNGEAPIVPRLECVEEGAGGKLTARFGYRNDNGVSVSIPYGARNLFLIDRHNDRPSTFAPGDNAFAFKVPFGSSRSLTWALTPKGGRTTVVTATASSPRCDAENSTLICADRCDAQLGAACSQDGISHNDCVNYCLSEVAFFRDDLGCGSEWNAYMRCNTATAPAASNWDCSFPGLPAVPASPNCDAELGAAYACAGF
jgi:trypsin